MQHILQAENFNIVIITNNLNGQYNSDYAKGTRLICLVPFVFYIHYLLDTFIE